MLQPATRSETGDVFIKRKGQVQFQKIAVQIIGRIGLDSGVR